MALPNAQKLLGRHSGLVVDQYRAVQQVPDAIKPRAERRMLLALAHAHPGNHQAFIGHLIPSW